MTDVQRLLDVLGAAGVDFVVVGGVALVLRGSSRVTLDLDLCYAGEVAGVGAYAQVSAGSSELVVGDTPIRVMDLDALERSKRAAGRAKDLLDLAEIAEIRRRLRE